MQGMQGFIAKAALSRGRTASAAKAVKRNIKNRDASSGLLAGYILLMYSLFIFFGFSTACASETDDNEFLKQTGRSCKTQALTSDETKRLNDMLENYLRRSGAQSVLDCNEFREKSARAKESLNKGLAETSTLCRESLERFAVFKHKAETDGSILTKYNEMLSIGEIKSACEPVVEFMDAAESTRTELVACFKSINGQASPDQVEVRKLALSSAQRVGLLKTGFLLLYRACFQQ